MKNAQENNATSMAEDIASAFHNYQQSDAYRELITKHIEKMVSDSIDHVFGWGGDYRKQLEDALKAAMPKDITKMVDLAKYNTLFAQSLQTTWADNALPDQVVKQAQKVVLEFTDKFKIPEYVTMTELIEAFISENEDTAAQEGWDRPHTFFKWHEERFDGGRSFSLGIEDHKQESSRYSSTKEKDHAFQFERNIYLSPTGEEHNGHDTYAVFSGRLGDTPLGNSKIKAFYSDFDKLVACMYYGGTKLVLDTEDVDDFYYPSHD